MSYRLFNLKKPPLFRPKFNRANETFTMADYANNLEVKGVIGNSQSSASFRYSQDRNVKSTQQLNIDYTFFENHTFFDSAASKTNISFDNILNNYPFDGTLAEVEDFEDKLTGFETYVFKQFAKNVGYLIFSGSAVGETGNKGQYISVKDGKGLTYPQFSKTTSAKPVLDPGTKSITLEMFLFVPQEANDNQVIVQKRNSLSKNLTLALSHSSTTTQAGLVWSITSGSDFLHLTSSITKGKFVHLSAQYDREGANQNLSLFLDGKLITTSSTQYEMETISFNNADFVIGSGSQVRLNEEIFDIKQTLSGAIDELRFFHSTRSPHAIKKDMFKQIYATDDLKLYFRFNEVSASYGLNSVALDSSGNSLHSKVSNFTLDCRSTGSYIAGASPLTAESMYRNPILFIDYPPLLALNTLLLNSASYYDEYNPNLITKLVPQHYFTDGSSFEGLGNQYPLQPLDKLVTQPGSFPGDAQTGTAQLLVSFLLIWAKFFDEMKLFIDSFGSLRNVNYDNEDDIADNFLHSLAQYYNIELPDIFSNADIYQLVSGENIYTEYSRRSVYTLKYIQNQLWKRLLTNAVHFHKSKGTIESLKSILRSLGINVDDIFKIREYGGKSKLTLAGSRVNKTDNFSLFAFTSSLAPAAPVLSAQGIPSNKPYFLGSYLSGSRIEVGNPEIQGSFVEKSLYSPHGISNNDDDGLFTSGSFSFEGVYRFPALVTGSYATYQSLARIHVTGSDALEAVHGVTTNLVLKSGSVPEVYFYARPGINTSLVTSPLLTMHIYSASVFDGGLWNISFGRKRGDIVDPLTDAVPLVSSSYFLRVGKVGDRRLNNVHVTSSFFKETKTTWYENSFQVADATTNSSGSFVVIGSQSLASDSGYRYLNNSGFGNSIRATNFAGEVGFLRFWSEYIDENEWYEHVKNPTSVGVEDPRYHYNFLLHNTGTFERMRVYTRGKQATTASNMQGDIRFFDFSQNNLHFAGTGFEPSVRVVKYNQLRYTTLDPQFDVLGTTEKIRIRSMQDTDRLQGNAYPYATGAPVYNVPESEEVEDDLRFSLEMSIVKALNEDIVTMFSDYQFIENSLGRTNLLFSDTYPQLDQLRKNYFENLEGKLDVEKYYKLFKWFNDTFTELIESMLPSKTKFMGVNFVIESHALERHKFKYLYDEIYLKALDRDPNRGTIFLSQFVGTLKKF